MLKLIAAFVTLAALAAAHDGDKRIYTIGVGRDERPWEFYDAGTGEVHGLNVDFMREACDLAGKKCEFVAFKNYEICWNAQKNIARALSNEYFDGCSGYLRTTLRDLTYAHSTPYGDETPYSVYGKEGTNVEMSDLKRNNDYIITYHENFAWDNNCLKNNGLSLKDSQIITGVDYAEMRKQVNDGEADFAFLPESEIEDDYVRVGDPLTCTLGGRGVMTRYGNSILEWLNPAIEEMIDSPMYDRACYVGKKAYGGGDPFCKKK